MENIKLYAVVFLVLLVTSCHDEPEWKVQDADELHICESVVIDWDETPKEIRKSILGINGTLIQIHSDNELRNFVNSDAGQVETIFSKSVLEEVGKIDFSKHTLLLAYNMLDAAPYRLTNVYSFSESTNRGRLHTSYYVNDRIIPSLNDDEVCLSRVAVLVYAPLTAVMLYDYSVTYETVKY